jgi:hypothetical protein
MHAATVGLFLLGCGIAALVARIAIRGLTRRLKDEGIYSILSEDE